MSRLHKNTPRIKTKPNTKASRRIYYESKRKTSVDIFSFRWIYFCVNSLWNWILNLKTKIKCYKQQVSRWKNNGYPWLQGHKTERRHVTHTWFQQYVFTCVSYVKEINLQHIIHREKIMTKLTNHPPPACYPQYTYICNTLYPPLWLFLSDCLILKMKALRSF